MADPAAWHIAQNTPALIQWDDGAGRVARLGLRHPSPQSTVAADIGLDTSQRTALLRFCVPVGLRNATQKKVLLYVVVRPDNIQSVATQSIEDTAPDAISAFLSAAPQCSTAADIVSFRVSLTQPAMIVGPAGLTDLYPTKGGFGRILDALCSLSRATDLAIYIPSGHDTALRINALGTVAATGTLQPSARKHALNTLYGGGGGVDIGHLLQTAHESPPAYHEPTPSPPLHSESATTRKRPLSRGGRSPSPKKRDTGSSPVVAEAPSWQGRLLALELEVSTLRRRLATQEGAPSETEDISVADHLGRLDEDVRQMRVQMDRIEALLQQGDSGSETPTSETGIMARVGDMVDDRLWEVRETESVIEEMVDDKFLLWKIDFQDWLEDQSREDIPRHIREAVRLIVPDILSRLTFTPHFSSFLRRRHNETPL